MKRLLLTSVLSLVLLPSLATTQESPPVAEAEPATQKSQEGLVPIESLVERVAMEMGREFVIDTRVRGVMAHTTRDSVDFESLLGILRVAGLVAIEAGEQIHVVPEVNMRTAPTRVLQEDDPGVSDHEVVTRIILVPAVTRSVRNPQGTVTLEATQLVPVLRPMMSQAAQLGAAPNSNELIIVDRYDNVRRITAVVAEIAAGFDD